METKGGYVCVSQRLGRDEKGGGAQRTEEKPAGQGKCEIRQGLGISMWLRGKRLKKMDVVDTKESGGRQHVEFR